MNNQTLLTLSLLKAIFSGLFLFFSFNVYAHPEICEQQKAATVYLDSEGTVCLQKIKVIDDSGTQYFKAVLQWLGPNQPDLFDLTSVEPDTSEQQDSSTFTFNNGILDIPAVEIPKLFGTERYSAQLVLQNKENKTQFKLVESGVYINPNYIANQTWKPYGMLDFDERRSVDLLGYSLNYANLANAVYDFEMVQVDDWELIEQADTDSGMQAGLYLNHETDEIALAFRGTETCDEFSFSCQKESFLDIAADALLAVGQVDEQFEHAFEFTQDVVNRYGDRTIIVTGHSLGGGLAQAVGTSFGLKTYAFNSAPVPEKFFEDFPTELNTDEINETVHVLADIHDPVSNTDEAGKAYINSSHVSPLIQFDFNEKEIMPDELGDLDALRFNKHGMVPLIDHANDLMLIYASGW